MEGALVLLSPLWFRSRGICGPWCIAPSWTLCQCDHNAIGAWFQFYSIHHRSPPCRSHNAIPLVHYAIASQSSVVVTAQSFYYSLALLGQDAKVGHPIDEMFKLERTAQQIHMVDKSKKVGNHLASVLPSRVQPQWQMNLHTTVRCMGKSICHYLL